MSGTTSGTRAPSLRALLLLLCTALALVVAGNSALAIALPEVARDLTATQTELTWVIDAYALTFAALLLPAGIAADRVGRRTLLVGGLLLFGAAGIASAWAADPGQLVALRAAAGVGAAAVFPVTLSALVDAYPPERRGFAVAVWSAVSAAGAVGGSLLGGALLEVAWWGSLQLASGVAALLLVPGAAVLVAEHRDRSLSLDPLGAALSAAGLAAVVFAVIEAPRRGWTDPLTLATVALGAVTLAGFVVHELRTPAPALDVRLFRDRGLSAGSLLVSAQFFASLGLFVLAPQYLQLVREQTPLQAAAALLVIPVGVGAASALTPLALERIGPRWPGAGGLAGMAAGFAVLAGTVDDGSLGWLAAGLLVFGVGFGLAVTPGTVPIIDGLPPQRRSVASAVNDVTREVGGVLGIAVLSSVLLGAYRTEVAPALDGVPPEAAAAAREGASTAVGAAGGLGPDGAALAEAARAAFAGGLGTALGVGAAVLGVAAVVIAALAPAGRRTPSDADPEPVEAGR
ncbi:MFS transporter [Geodermatophilus sp. DSM 44513]|uniref:MFS transporter n=1 Tax=Geodermatophilus sp. DSM 44513 TaxID=1528104 RepID=UPI001270DE5B|nr:MFS transporter [Geodermatophilus sp. DSM 44513]WNV76794.1 MFS transporter [Geodermatophilus sp. DSM 44513]